jgi:hypothetical protein
MANVVAEMELTADGKQKMVEQGVVALLVNISMEKNNVEVTAAALGALDRLSFMSQSKSYFVDAGTVPAMLSPSLCRLVTSKYTRDSSLHSEEFGSRRWN